MQVFDLIILVFFTESKAALTEEMYSLIDAVVKQQQTTEGSVASSIQTKESPNSEQQSRKRKLQFKASEIEAVRNSVKGRRKKNAPKGNIRQRDRKKIHLSTLLKRKHPKQRAVEKRRRLPKHRLLRMPPYVFLMQIELAMCPH